MTSLPSKSNRYWLFLLTGSLFLWLSACGNGPTQTGQETSTTTQTKALATQTLRPLPTGTARPMPPLTLPKDEAKHDYITEWWYYTGHLKGENNVAYGFEFVIFQINYPGIPTVYTAHYAITDHQRKDFFYTSIPLTNTTQPGGPGFNFTLGDWHLQGNDGQYTIIATSEPYKINLKLASAKPAIFHGDKGIEDLGPIFNTYYYSRPNLVINGTINDHGTTVPVEGTAWMDKQWGDFLVQGQGSLAAWDWYSVELANKAVVMLYIIRDGQSKPVYQAGTYVSPEGIVHRLKPADFTAASSGKITTKLGHTYPSGWEIQIPLADLKLTIAPVIPDQELNIVDKLLNVDYWEGEVVVKGTQNNQPIQGQGYIELTGYDR